MTLAEQILPEALVNKTSARMVLDSLTPYGPQTRLTSIYQVAPKMVLAEMNTHASHARSDRSSRAVPPEKLIEEARSGEGLAMPDVFRERTRGMGGGELFTGAELRACQLAWIEQALRAADATEAAVRRGEAKETANRHLDSYIYVHTLRTATRDGWLNYLGLRLHHGANPTIQRLARCIYRELKNSTPTLLQPGEWHLPFTNDDDWRDARQRNQNKDGDTDVLNMNNVVCELQILSSARCAHLSYNAAGTAERIDLKKARKINEQLRTVPLHAGPFEHQTQVDEIDLYHINMLIPNEEEKAKREMPTTMEISMKNSHLRGKFTVGWIQYRKLLPGEAVAPLPEGYDPL